MKNADLWGRRGRRTDFRDMREGRDYIFTDASEQDEIIDIQMLTYNHAQFIRQAIESVLCQKTQYKYRLVIADDCSTDGTTDIVREYQTRYPDRIATIIWTHNVGPQCNDITCARVKCRGKYAAVLEGDDYWTDERKLEKAISFLEAHPDYFAFAHSVKLVDEEGKLVHGWDEAYMLVAPKEEYVYPADNLRNFYLWKIRYLSQNGAIVCRNYQLNWSEENWDALARCRQVGDIIFNLCLTCEGKSYYSREIMSAYRRIYTGTSHTAYLKNNREQNRCLDEYLRNQSMAEFLRAVYGKDLLCIDNLARETSNNAAQLLSEDFSVKNLGIYAGIQALEALRRLKKRKDVGR